MVLDEAVLRDSTVPRDIARAARVYAAASDPEAHVVLVRHLADEAFLMRLDSEEDYDGPQRHLRLAGIVRELFENSAPAAAATLVTLTRAPTFTSRLQRAFLLVLALEHIRPSPPEAVAFWRRHSEPNAALRNVVPDVLANNGSEPAVALLEERLLSPAFSEDDRTTWLRGAVLRNRNRLTILDAGARLLGRFGEPMRSRLIAALFDHRPRAWYVACTWPTPPPLSSFAESALARLLEIGEALLREHLDEELRLPVESTVSALTGSVHPSTKRPSA
jgi:hypothetical protein